MKNIKFNLFFLIGVFFLTSVNSFAIESTSTAPLIKTVTLWVKKYSDLENQLNESIVQQNKNKTQQFLSDDFEERKSDNPNAPIPKEDWIQMKMKQSTKSIPEIQQMAVRTINNIYIVSYLSFIKDTSKSTFIVDVWKENGTTSQLMVRYSS